MPITITVPRLGWSMDEGTFVGWLKKDGESVKAGEPLFTLEGDKASQEVEANESGILRIPPDAPRAGAAVSVGTVLGYLVGEKEESVGQAFQPAGAPGLSSPAHGWATGKSPQPADKDVCPTLLRATGGEGAGRSGGKIATQDQIAVGTTVSSIAISPRARRRAAELGVDCRDLKASGRSGRIREADVLAAAKEARAPGPPSMRRTIAQRTAESFARAPHFYLRAELDATALLEFRRRRLPQVEQAASVRLTLTDLLLRAQALALHDCPEANAIWQDGQVVRLPGCDVGLVVGLADGLLMPIVRGADRGGLAALAKQRASLVEAARAGRLTAEAMRGGASSLSNLGNTRVDELAAVIAPPQSSMLAVGRIAPRPWVGDGQLVVRTTLKLCLSVDHRVMDGGAGAKFLGRVVELLEHPVELARE
jgi:pyruvate dehydrogenase E2 component (dihydrolipoamide acetyltransferase)